MFVESVVAVAVAVAVAVNDAKTQEYVVFEDPPSRWSCSCDL